MGLVGSFLYLLIGFLVIGTVAAIRENGKQRRKPDHKPADPPRVIVTQKVPSVFDTFKGKRK